MTSPTSTVKKMWRLSAGPTRAGFYGFVVRDAARLWTVGIRIAVLVRNSARYEEIERVNLNVFIFFLALVDGVGEEGEFRRHPAR